MRLALRGVCLSIAAGECVALVGHNGSGKTTLLKIAAQLTRPTRGKIAFDLGENPISLEEVKSRVGMVGHHTLLYEELTAEENLIFFAKLFGLENPAEKARQALEPVGLAGRADGPRAHVFARHAPAPLDRARFARLAGFASPR